MEKINGYSAAGRIAPIKTMKFLATLVALHFTPVSK